MRWAMRIIRFFGVANILLGSVGLLAALDSVRLFRGGPLHPTYPCLAEAFYVESSIDLVCVVSTIGGGIYLWRFTRAGLTISNAVFGFEIANFLLDYPLLRLVLRLVLGNRPGLCDEAIGSVGGIGNMGTGIQLVIVYPLVALIALNLAYCKLRRAQQDIRRE
jgi:hypothetical protein